MIIHDIVELKWIEEYLNKRWLTAQYIKAKRNILSWFFIGNFLKEKNPKWCNIHYFRINKQYRAIGIIDKNKLKIYKIDNHSSL